MDDRRKHQRFKLDDACIINHEKTVGTIIDISVGGLSCSCLDQGICSKGLSTQVDIYCKKGDLRAEGINIKVVDTEMVLGQFMQDVGLRKCRARFRQLDEFQQTQLTGIIVKSSLP
jgi:hypothetical protein